MVRAVLTVGSTIALAAFFRCFEVLYWGAEEEDSELLHRCENVVLQHVGMHKDMPAIVPTEEMTDCLKRLHSCCADTMKNLSEFEASTQQDLTQHPELKGCLEDAYIEDLHAATREVEQELSDLTLSFQSILNTSLANQEQISHFGALRMSL